MRFLGRMARTAAIATVLLATLAALPYDKEISYGFTRVPGPTPTAAPITPAAGLPYTRAGVNFTSQGTTCDAWLYTPKASGAAAADADDTDPAGGAAAAAGGGDHHPRKPFPVVIMAHGLGGQKDMGLHRFADAFARAGMAVLVFDYRTFGGSEGEPRHWVSPRRHVEDWRAALRFVKSGGLGPRYDASRVLLWGTSFAGGHVLVTAAEQQPGEVAAVISMIPHLDGLESSRANVRRRGLLPSLRLLLAGAHDATRAAAARLLRRAGLLLDSVAAADGSGGGVNSTVNSTSGGGAVTHGSTPLAALAPAVSRWLAPYLAPAYVKLIGTAEDMALMQISPEELKAYYAKHPSVYEGGWQPRVLARFSLETSSYRPVASLPRIVAPVLFLAAGLDELCPVGPVRAAAARVPGGRGSLVELDCTHFDAYRGRHFEQAAEAMVRFAREHLLGAE